MDLEFIKSVLKKEITYNTKWKYNNLIKKLIVNNQDDLLTQITYKYCATIKKTESTDNECLKRENDAMKKSIDIINKNCELKIQNDNLLKKLTDMNKSIIHNEKMYNDNINNRDAEIIRLKENNKKYINQKQNLNTRLVVKCEEIDDLEEQLIKLKLSYQKLNWDVLDRFSEIKYVDQLTTNNKKSPLSDNRKSLYNLYKHIKSVYFLNVNIKEEEVPDYTKLYSDVQNLVIKTIKGKSGTLLIPLEYDITMDGISGVLPYNAFKVPDNRLPAKYKGRVAFAVFSINHSFDNNKWQTTLRGLMKDL